MGSVKRESYDSQISGLDLSDGEADTPLPPTCNTQSKKRQFEDEPISNDCLFPECESEPERDQDVLDLVLVRRLKLENEELRHENEDLKDEQMELRDANKKLVTKETELHILIGKMHPKLYFA